MKAYFFQKIKQIDRLLTGLTKRKKDVSNNKVRNENGDITTNTTYIIRDNYEQTVH
jgi:hypothetical protein